MTKSRTGSQSPNGSLSKIHYYTDGNFPLVRYILSHYYANCMRFVITSYKSNMQEGKFTQNKNGQVGIATVKEYPTQGKKHVWKEGEGGSAELPEDSKKHS